MLEHLDQQTRLTGNQIRLFVVAIICNLLEFYDLFLVGFVLAFVAGPWKLTYGQSAMMLLSSGLGAILGAGVWGRLADAIGRRKVLMATVINFSIASGILALTPDNGWIFLSVFRFFVGFGVGGLYCVILPLVQEFMPASKRGLVGGLVTAAVPIGLGLGAVLGAFLGPVLGWRGLFAIGALPMLMILPIHAWVPESPHWLVCRGRFREARESLAWALQIDVKGIPLTVANAEVRQPAEWRELFHYPRSVVVSWIGNLAAQTGIYGLALWVPTLFMQVLGISPARASYLMIYCSISAFAGRVAFSYLSDSLGRRVSGGLYGFGAAVLVILSSYLRNEFLGAISVFWLMLIVTYFFADGGFAIVGPYAAEVWPSRLRATGMGAAYGFGGIGKIIGPLGMALIVGSSNIVKPEASVAKIIPAFIYLGAWYALAGIVYGFFGLETQGRSIEQIDSELG
ncbi:MAG: MFS transporter [Acidobacteriia bacterium]|nr:MFS transporter [Terriglobia bacterium]